MKLDALIGCTGFVGGALRHQRDFSAQYSSRNIDSIGENHYGTVVCAAAPGSMIEANKFPERDLAKIEALCSSLSTVKAERMVLISSIAVLKDFAGQDDETTTRFQQELAFDFFVETYGVKWDKAVDKLVKDRAALLTFYDYPAEHWKHIRTSNPIESTFATVRHRTKRTKGCLSRQTGIAMAFKLMNAAQGKWRKLDGRNRLPEIIQGVEFRDGLRQLQTAA